MSDASSPATARVFTWSTGHTLCNGVEIYWEQAGPASAEPVVLINGLSRQLVDWPDSFCDGLLAQGLRVLRFDNRDCGLSGEAGRGIRFNMPRSILRNRLRLPIVSDYTLHDMAADTLALMDALQLPRAHLVGVSMGGMIAQIIAGTAPQRALSLCSIMSGSNHPWSPGPVLAITRQMFGKRSADQSRDTIVERSVTMRKLLRSPAYPIPEAELRRLAGRDFDRAFRPGGILRQTHAILATGSIEALLPKVTAPTVVIHGSADPMVRLTSGRRSARLIPNAKLELIPGMGHDLPEALVPKLLELIVANIGRGKQKPDRPIR
ncbi:alpha/beta hydrolase [Hydrocarboniphaga sp.]|uniref:alpha/beta fold hydrolase n=1 Tax=Hydrocarboniphaga sp. TaxID=2033016 RepID=UPI0026314FA9|nr:alpha/beta hydrolase [Hydrocarboniphaga sp.]